jgi:hypothetical protein
MPVEVEAVRRRVVLVLIVTALRDLDHNEDFAQLASHALAYAAAECVSCVRICSRMLTRSPSRPRSRLDPQAHQARCDEAGGRHGGQPGTPSPRRRFASEPVSSGRRISGDNVVVRQRFFQLGFEALHAARGGSGAWLSIVSFRTAAFADFARRLTRGVGVTDFGGDPAFLERACCGFSRAITRFLLLAFLGNLRTP